MNTGRRTVITGMAAGLLGSLGARRAVAADMPGVSATEIKIGNTMPYSGPASAYGTIGHAETAYFKMINDKGGINGRKIVYLTEDDAYSPPKTVEQTRMLVEQEGVAFMFNGLGTPTQTAVQKYLNMKKIPQLFISTGADKWGNYKEFPWTMGWQPSYRIEGQIYAKYILKNKPAAKIAVIYQNDDFGKDYVNGVKDILGADYAKMVVKEATYETSDPTTDSQVVGLQSAGADTLLTFATPKFAAQIIRKVYDINWHPLHFLTNVSISVGSVIKPAGVEKAVGIVTSTYIKDDSDPAWANDPGLNEWRVFMDKYMPGADHTETNYIFAYGISFTLAQVLRQCGNDLTRENIMRQATNIHDLEVPVLLPGIRVNTSPTNYHPLRQLQLARWNGKTWERFGGLIEGAGA
uniref:Branched-chain amino acid ABC transporter substrate-binding protein n=1 Tax=Acidicaldus sp. TaxID=1872105 RepID=A0A8J4M6Q5_9PROT